MLNLYLKGGGDDVGESNSTITEAEFYEGLKGNHKHQSEIAKEKAPRMLKYWKSILKSGAKNQVSILEIGCGTGQYYSAWKEQKVKWMGLEVNKDMLEFCQEKEIPVSNIDLTSQKLPEKYGVVFLSQVLEHVIDPNLFISKIKENMFKGGVLHIDVPNHDSMTSLYRRLNPSHPEYGFLQPNHHLIAYNKKSLSYLLNKNGFKLIKVRAYSNDDNTFGQLVMEKSIMHKFIFWLSNIFGKGSLLVAIAIKE